MRAVLSQTNNELNNLKAGCEAASETPNVNASTAAPPSETFRDLTTINKLFAKVKGLGEWTTREQIADYSKKLVFMKKPMMASAATARGVLN
ncbi:MAG: hypothetical protein ACKPKO_61085, partial [Candidatus Fonsibacter sp.]